jgi:DNA-binding XRE family transcriptional regulator
MDFSIVSKAGISQTDFAKIIGVSRVSVCKWMTGKTKPHHLHNRRISQLLAAIELAVKDEDLPLPAGIESGQVVRRVKQIIVERIKQLKANEDN